MLTHGCVIKPIMSSGRSSSLSSSIGSPRRNQLREDEDLQSSRRSSLSSTNSQRRNQLGDRDIEREVERTDIEREADRVRTRYGTTIPDDRRTFSSQRRLSVRSDEDENELERYREEEEDEFPDVARMSLSSSRHVPTFDPSLPSPSRSTSSFSLPRRSRVESGIESGRRMRGPPTTNIYVVTEYVDYRKNNVFSNLAAFHNFDDAKAFVDRRVAEIKQKDLERERRNIEKINKLATEGTYVKPFSKKYGTEPKLVYNAAYSGPTAEEIIESQYSSTESSGYVTASDAMYDVILRRTGEETERLSIAQVRLF